MKNLITYLKALWRRGLDSQRKEVGVISGEATIEHPFSTYSAPFGTCWQPSGKLHSVVRCAAMLVMLFTIGSGNVWGAEQQITPATSGWNSTAGSQTGTVGVITVSTTRGVYNTQMRVYASESLTVSCSSGYTITKIVFTANSTSYNKLASPVSWSGTTGTYTNASGTTSVTISSPSQTRLTKIVVTYTAAAPTYNVYLMSGCTGGSYSSNKGTSGSGTGTYSSCTKYSGISSGTSVTITATPSSGYQFDGWTNGGYSIILDDESNEITPSSTTSTTATFTMPSSDVVIWDCNFSETCANTMTINKGTATSCTFSLGTSGSGIASCSGVSTTVTVTPNTGYGTPSVTQSGASKTPTITGSGTSWTVTYPANTTGTSTINVSCSANNYTITLDKDLTPTTAGTASITATYNSNSNLTSAITKPTKTGWTFGGYFTAKNGGGTQIIDASGNVIASVSGYTDASRNWKHAGNITLYAKWTCTVTWSVNGLTNVYSTQTVTYNSSGSKVASVPTPDPASYCGDIFAGWSRKNAGAESKTTSYYDDLFKTVGDSPDIKNIGDITFYAVFANEE